MAMSDGHEKLLNAVRILVDEKERIKERLWIAFSSQLSLINAKEDLPDELIDEFYQLRDALSDADMPYGYGEHAAAKIQGLTEDEASAWARAIFSMFLAISEARNTIKLPEMETQSVAQPTS